MNMKKRKDGARRRRHSRSRSRSNRRRRSRNRRRRNNNQRVEIRDVPLILYCGNNRLNPNVVAGLAEIGTNYRCLRKGFGAGFHSPVDMSFLDDYEPIDERKIYCGDNDDLPQGYDRIGNLPACFQKGFGVGKRQRALNP